jgi:hypothetical protein
LKKKIDISSIEKKDFLVPKTELYFEKLHQKILENTIEKAAFQKKAIELLKQESNSQKALFEIEESYFNWLSEKIAAKVRPTPSQLPDFFISNKWSLIAIAASLVLAFGVIFQFLRVDNPSNIATIDSLSKKELLVYAIENQLSVDISEHVDSEIFELKNEEIKEELYQSELEEIIEIDG